MTIKPGQSYGAPARLAASSSAVTVDSDRAISRSLDDARRAHASPPVFRVTGGDLFRTLGGSSGMEFPIDAGEVLIDGRHHYFAAHVVARRHGWRDFAVAMNAQWVGEWNFGPKAHPNDGIVDAYEGHLRMFEWRQVRARLLTGSHLPHPRIDPTRAKAITFEFTQDYDVFIDGEALGRAKHLAIRMVPDALTVIA